MSGKPASASKKKLFKVIHLYTGSELMGSATSVNSRNAEIEDVGTGVDIHSKKTDRVIFIPWSNIKAGERIVDPA